MDESILNLVYRTKARPCFTPSQNMVLDLALKGQNIFITGGAGTGKTFLMRELIRILKALKKNVLVCASTGTAAVACGGTTIHRAFNFPSGAMINYKTLKVTARTPQTVKAADVIIIDEISMCRCDLFEAITASVRKCEAVTGRSIQMIVSGDFCQLPPVIADKGERDLLTRYYAEDVGQGYAFQTPGWNSFRFIQVALTEEMRQDNKELISHLWKIRMGDADAINYFNKTASREIFADGIYLCGTNQDAENINLDKLMGLPGAFVNFKAEINGSIENSDMVVPHELNLKVGARVMACTNHPEKLYVNGSMGTVVKCDNQIVVEMDNGFQTTFDQCEWDVYEYYVDENDVLNKRIRGSYRQYPLRVAYAITIHKSQGATYDRVNLNPKCWASGQLYVALSRIRDISGLCLMEDIERSYLVLDDRVKQFYEKLQVIKNDESIVEPQTAPNLLPTIGTTAEKNVVKTKAMKSTSEPASVPQKKQRTVGRPTLYGSETKTMRIPVALKDVIQNVIRMWAEDPEKRVIVCIDKEKQQS